MAEFFEQSEFSGEITQVIMKDVPKDLKEQGHRNPDPEEMDAEEEVSEEDYESLNSQLDALNSALDVLEHKNDTIRTQLVELLQSNRETRGQITGGKESGSSGGSHDGSEEKQSGSGGSESFEKS